MLIQVGQDSYDKILIKSRKQILKALPNENSIIKLLTHCMAPQSIIIYRKMQTPMGTHLGEQLPLIFLPLPPTTLFGRQYSSP